MAKTLQTSLSPLAPESFPDMLPVPGVRLGSGRCGIKSSSTKLDLMLAVFDRPATVAGVFTKSSTAGAPVRWCRKHLPKGKARALIINSGNANVYTGKAGDDAVKAAAAGVAKLVGGRAGDVFVASTGVIGETLPIDRIVKALPGVHRKLLAKPRAWHDAAVAIMTTDTFPKGASVTTEIGGESVTISGIAKGSGMIAPDMATMLAYVFTDAKLPADVLQKLLKSAADKSFNAITVDSDTSTSDTLQLFATGQAKHSAITRLGEPALRAFRKALDALCLDLAHQVIKDGEGAQKFIEVAVTGAKSARAARRIGLAIANSPLVKTAIAGGDANWGRIVMAVGKSGEAIAETSLEILVGGHIVACNGAPPPDYDETPVARHMAGRNIEIVVDVGVGRGKATVWTCDLTHGYIEINADYRS
ncbi:MAG: bifunctional ornithine acetyltransferase/N-acetylglutamate synthase [Rhodospirillaceae bacterium]|nr:bifunctional ornithine acetyltransferase/N-acetylglutamate synthase [Rhodospirillaceae bacterium]|tara:strand:+ start:6898 stop:8151 length:1254 start_codon:yes stop_codon:yes gene_type:complete